jgi:hypothetical protein
VPRSPAGQPSRYFSCADDECDATVAEKSLLVPDPQISCVFCPTRPMAQFFDARTLSPLQVMRECGRPDFAGIGER